MEEYHWNRFLQPQKTNYVFDANGLSNDTLACDDDTHKVVLCTPTTFLKIIVINLTMKPFYAFFQKW